MRPPNLGPPLLALVLLCAGCARTTPTPSAYAACTPHGTRLTVVARSIAFDPGCLAAPSNQALTIVLNNEDAGIPHNVSIYRDDGGSAFHGAIVTGVRMTTYQVSPLAPGTYSFRCDVHPAQMTGTFIVR
jgi:plastocyanin